MILILIISALILIYIILNSNYNYWKKRGIPGPKPTFLCGNLGKAFYFKKSTGEIYNEIYEQFKNEAFVGVYKVFSPLLLVRDPDLIKEVTVKSFGHFRDNDFIINKKSDPIMGRNPFVLKGEEWKIVRAQLTPGFTSGKMKWLYPHLEENSQKLVKFIREKASNECYELKELCTRFTLNNVASCAFGLDGKCFEDDNAKFRQLAKDFFSQENWSIVCLYIAANFPFLARFLAIRVVSKKTEEKLVDLVSQTLKYREKNNVIRNDFLHILSELKKTCKDYEFTDVDVAAHAAGFFGDGYETSSIVMSFVLYYLSRNLDVQQKLREEIQEAFANNNNKIPYEILQSLPYLDAVLLETLRRQPPIFSLQKQCTKHFNDPSRNLSIEKGTSIILPLYAIQNDPKYYPDPELFKPERFLEENKEKLVKYTYFPFGEGPRACLGQRFGTLQIKSGLAYVIQNYEITFNKKTKFPLTFDPVNILVSPIGGLWVDFRKL